MAGLTPSQRIELIKSISNRLGRESHNHVKLTLRQFGIDPAVFNGLEETWVLESIQDSPDSILLDVAQHVGFQVIASSPVTDVDCWKPACFRLFLSHLSKDAKVGLALAQELLPRHIALFVAHVDIQPSREWQAEIEKALRSADALAALVRPGFVESEWADQEIGWALGRELAVIPLRAGADPHGFVGKIQGLSVKGKTNLEVAPELFGILARHPLARPRLAEVIVTSFENAWSWEGCRLDMGLLEQFPYLDEGHLARMEAALQANPKIADTHGVPGRVAQLTSRMRGTAG